MFLSCRSVPLHYIYCSAEWNIHPWEIAQISAELERSFNHIGVLHPPVVREESQDRFTVIDGSKRLQFIKTASPENVTCMVVDDAAPSTYILDVILSDQGCGGPFSLAEKAQFVAIASKFLPSTAIQKEYLPLLGLKQTPSTIPLLLKILEQDRTIIREVHEDRLKEKMVTEILNLFEDTDRIALVRLFRQLRLGDGKQKRFFNLIRDNAYRIDSSISSYLAKDEIQQILNHSELNVPQKIFHLGNYLQRQTTPSLVRAEEDFLQQVRKLQLPTNHSITHSQSFEKDDVTLTIRFNSLSDCEKYLKQKFS